MEWSSQWSSVLDMVESEIPTGGTPTIKVKDIPLGAPKEQRCPAKTHRHTLSTLGKLYV